MESGNHNFTEYFKDTFDLDSAIIRTITTDISNPRHVWENTVRCMLGMKDVYHGNPLQGAVAILGYKQTDSCVIQEGTSNRVVRAAKLGGRTLIDDRSVSVSEIEDVSLGSLKSPSLRGKVGIRNVGLTNVPNYGVDFQKRDLPIEVKDRLGIVDMNKILPVLKRQFKSSETENMNEAILEAIKEDKMS